MSFKTPRPKPAGPLPATLTAVLLLAALAACAPAAATATATATAKPKPTAVPATDTPAPTSTPTATSTPLPIESYPSLYQTLADYFPVGAALEPAQLDGERHVALLTHHFNSLTAENVMKPESIGPSEGTFNWTGADRLTEFAKANGMAVHGHTLVWHQQTGEWMFNDSEGKPLYATPENKQLVLRRLEEYIRAVVGRYKDSVNVWDVVNEVIDASQPDCMRQSKWYLLTGTDYIATAFRVANQVDPDAVMLINDYGTTDPAKQKCLYKVVSDLRAKGVPVEGVGHQMHVNIENPTATAIEQTIEMFAQLGLEQHVTELDMSIYTNDSDRYSEVPAEILVTQGYRYQEIFDVFRRQAENIQSVTFWGMADDHTWLKTFPVTRINLPLPFDENLQPKPAYWGIVDPSQLPVRTKHLDSSQGTPAIDGEPESLWDMRSWTRIGEEGALSASFQTLWDKQRLYVFADVKDSTPDGADAVEIYIDQNNGKTEAYEGDEIHAVCRAEGCTGADGAEFIWTAAEDGYRLEAAFPLDQESTLKREIGFDLRVTDGAQPDSPLSWNDTTHGQDSGTANYGTLAFVKSVAVAVAVPGTPVIDGVEDAVWAAANEISTDVWALGSSGATAKVRTLWDGEYLYVYAVVTDKLLSKASGNSWEQDSIEVFLDQNNAKTPTYEADDAQYRINFENYQTFNGDAKPELIKSAARVVSGGYVVELSIKFDYVVPAEGGRIGFDFQVNNDEDGDGVRDSIAKWFDPTNETYQNTSGMGVLEFGKPK
ncbi:MAG: endo-1,4-beta-xylanase [Anaerolineales bacterium]|nr:endo-1,4-beta-xylanase [Anaerolineales bacterium]